MTRILLFIASALPLFASAAERPNIITVFIDDMGWTDLSCLRAAT